MALKRCSLQLSVHTKPVLHTPSSGKTANVMVGIKISPMRQNQRDIWYSWKHWTRSFISKQSSANILNVEFWRDAGMPVRCRVRFSALCSKCAHVLCFLLLVTGTSYQNVCALLHIRFDAGRKMQEIFTLFPFNGKLIVYLNPFPLPDPNSASSFLGRGGKRKEGAGSTGPRQNLWTLHCTTDLTDSLGKVRRWPDMKT